MYVFRAIITLFAILLGTTSIAQDATNTMTFTIDGTELALVTSPILENYPSQWDTVSETDYVHDFSIIGYLLKDDAVC